MYKRIIVMVTLLAGAAELSADEVENYDSGKLKVSKILSHDETGVAAYNKKNTHCAETQNLAKDLNIDEIGRFFGCKTLIGQSFITETLKSPLSPEDKDSVLAHRQNAIRLLVENPELKQEVEALLEFARLEEQEVIKLMSEFFVGKTCPELKRLEILKQQNPYFYPVVEFFTKNPIAKTIGTATLTLESAGFIGATGVGAYLTYLQARNGDGYIEPAAGTAYFAGISGFLSYLLYQDYSTGSEKRSTIHSLNQLIAIAERIEKLSAQHGIKNQFKISDIKDAEGVALINALKHSRYKDKKSYLFMVPLVHTFLYKMYANEKHLAELFACVAEMDAYNAIATKIIESQEEKNKFCFVTFKDASKPVVQTEGFWNVLVKGAVSNSMTEEKHVILTGPNAGGKTTTIRAILQNIVLGQTFGVAAAEQFEFTMFDIIHSYINISDDLVNGLSLFASEVKRAQDILQRIKTLESEESDKKFFFALDELFTGTNAEDGETCAYEFVKRIASFGGIQFIYSTHFNKLKELGKDSETCVNYKVGAPTKNSLGKLVYPFTLSQGANEVSVALDMAKEANLFA